MFKIDPSQTSRVDLVPNNQSSASIRTNPFTNSLHHVTSKENVSSNTVNSSSTGLVHTARTRRPQPKGNTRNDRVPSASRGSKAKKNVIVEDHRRNLSLSKNQKTISSECNNIKLAIRNDNSEIVCGTCCLNLSVFLGTVRFGNDHIAAILGYGDLKWGNITIAWVYFVEGLGYNRFSVGQFCDADLEVAFRRNTCFIRDLDGVDLLKGNRTTNLYTINLMARATPTKSCKEKAKEPLTHPNQFRTQSSGFICFILICVVQCELQALMGETPEVIKNFLKNIYVRLQAPIIIVRTDNVTEFKNHALKEYFDSVGITHETSAAKTPQQNGVVERGNRTLVEAARIMLILSHAPLFLWAEAIATACYTQNHSAPTPTNSSNTRNSLHNVDEKSQQHALHQGNHTPLPTASAVDNVPNAVFEGDLFVNPFATPSTESAKSPTQNVDHLQTCHHIYQPYPMIINGIGSSLRVVIGELSDGILTRVNHIETDGECASTHLTSHRQALWNQKPSKKL
ncbi:retrovirus-related pol polyprotein from transposon TNT 1-94 [Tanacetum coccineum]